MINTQGKYEEISANETAPCQHTWIIGKRVTRTPRRSRRLIKTFCFVTKRKRSML